MRKAKKLFQHFSLFLIFLAIGIVVNAQEVISTGGDYHKAESGSISYTIGEVAIETYVKDDIILTQGFQQTNLKITTVKELPIFDFDIVVYPNPTLDFVNLKIDNEKIVGLKYKLIDQNGKLLQLKKVENPQTEISFDNLPSATYFIVVVNDNNELKTFKIIKQ